MSEAMRRQRKVKIVATLGPASNTKEIIRNLFVAGADVFRLNLSHGTHEDIKVRYDFIRDIESELKKIPQVCGSLREAMENLDKDRAFLTEGGVFTDDQIDGYISLKFEEIYKLEHTPHPIEFEMYYSQ